ncbi:MAG: hypothetical protein AVDCRST_MAG69-2590, partial [uncultured Solirubrobacteraceae bacterium]
ALLAAGTVHLEHRQAQAAPAPQARDAPPVARRADHRRRSRRLLSGAGTPARVASL